MPRIVSKQRLHGLDFQPIGQRQADVVARRADANALGGLAKPRCMKSRISVSRAAWAAPSFFGTAGGCCTFAQNLSASGASCGSSNTAAGSVNAADSGTVMESATNAGREFAVRNRATPL